MKLIRRNTFETNSSSTHSITIPKKIDEIYKTKRPLIRFNIGEFGWEWSKYELKDYIWTAICSNFEDNIEEYKEKIKHILSPYYEEIEFEEPIIEISKDGKYKWLESGCIDHGYELTDFLKDIFDNENLFINAILKGYVMTGNDNEEQPKWFDYIDDKDDCYHYFKGN